MLQSHVPELQYWEWKNPSPAYNGISFKGIEKAVGRLAAISSKSTSEEKTEGKSNSCKDRVGFQHNIQSFPAQIATAQRGILPVYSRQEALKRLPQIVTVFCSWKLQNKKSTKVSYNLNICNKFVIYERQVHILHIFFICQQNA